MSEPVLLGDVLVAMVVELHARSAARERARRAADTHYPVSTPRAAPCKATASEAP